MIHRPRVKRCYLVIRQIGRDESLRGKCPVNTAHVGLSNTEIIQPGGVRLVIVADGCHDQRIAAYHIQVISNVTCAAAKLTSHIRYQKRDVQNMNFLWQDMVLEMIVEHHYGVVRNRAADESIHLQIPYHAASCRHTRSSSRAAFTSSSRRTGVVWGAPFTISGCVWASSRISFIATTNPSSVSLDSVSAGSISKHSGTSSGK